MKKTSLFIFLFCSFIFMEAQLVQVSGYIYQKGDSSISLPHVSIVNKRTHGGYQSTADGFYTILMAPGDTTEVSLIGYKNARFTLPSTVIGSTYHKNIYLKDDVVTLGDYTKYSITWQKFKEAFASIEVVEEKKYITLDSKMNDRSPVNASPHIGLNGPISWLYNKLGKKAKEQEKLADLKQGNNADMEFTRRITNEYVMAITKLPEDKVNDFLTFCHLDNYFYAYATDYDIKAKFISLLPEFKKKYNIVDVPTDINTTPSDTVKTTPQ